MYIIILKIEYWLLDTVDNTAFVVAGRQLDKANEYWEVPPLALCFEDAQHFVMAFQVVVVERLC